MKNNEIDKCINEFVEDASLLQNEFLKEVKTTQFVDFDEGPFIIDEEPFGEPFIDFD